MASSLATLGLCLFGSAAFGQYAGSPSGGRNQPATTPPPARSAYLPGGSQQPAALPARSPYQTGTGAAATTALPARSAYATQAAPAVQPAVSAWQRATEPAPIQEVLEFDKEAPPKAGTAPQPMPVVQEPRSLEPARVPGPVLPQVVQEAPPLSAPRVNTPAVVPASYPEPVPIAVSGPGPIQAHQLNAATPMPAAEKPAEPIAISAPVAPVVLPEPVAVPAPVPEPAVAVPAIAPPPAVQAAPEVVPPVVIPETRPAPAVALPPVAPPPVLPAVPETVATPLPVPPPVQPWKPADQASPMPAPVAATAEPGADINLTALQPAGSAPPATNVGPAPNVPDDGQGNYVQLDPPGPQRLFRLDSEKALQERMRQEALSRPGQDKTEFPNYKPISESVFAGRSWPCQTMLVEPCYVCYKPLMFQELNSERYGWDLGFVQPFVSTGYFIKDLVFWPYRRAAFATCCDSGAGYCLPGDPVPYLLYPPYVSIPGTVAEAAVVAALVAIFP